MTDDDVERRLRAVERALTDADTPVRDLSDAAAVHERLDSLEAAVEDLTERLDALDATVQSLHGYVGELEAVNDRVERRADAARAAVERLEDEHRQVSAYDSPTSGCAESESSTDSGVPDGTRVAVENRQDGIDGVDGGGSAANPFDDGVDPTGDDDTGSLLDRVRESL